MKKLLVVVLVGMMALSSFAFADEINTPGEDQAGPQIERPEKGAFGDKIKDRIEEKRNQTGPERKDPTAYRAKMAEVISAFAPDFLASFEANWAAHDSVHASLDQVKTELRQENLDELEAVLEDIKARLEAGDITAQEGRAEFQAVKETYKAEFEAIKAVIEDLKATYNVDKEVVKALHESLKAAVEAEDADQVIRLLAEILASLDQHIEFDNMKLDYLQSL